MTTTTTLREIAATCIELLDGTGDFDANMWFKNPRFIRVYVTAVGRKRKDCGFFSINDRGDVDFSTLSRQKGAIRAVVADAIDAAVPHLPAPTPRQPRIKPCDECHMYGSHSMDCALMA